MRENIKNKMDCFQINSDHFHPEQKYQCNFDISPTKTVIIYGKTVLEAMKKMDRELKRYDL